MKFTPAIVFASVLTVLTSGNTSANDAERRALYSSLNVLTFINKDTSAELKVTAAQEKGLQASKAKRDKLWTRFAEECGKLERSKLSASEKNVKHRALETQLSDDLFKSYGETLRPEQVKRVKQIVLQVRGMEMFDYPEVREALKIGDKEVKVLRAAFDKMAREMVVQFSGKRQGEAADQRGGRTGRLLNGLQRAGEGPRVAEQ
jgi:hypothetical protein